MHFTKMQGTGNDYVYVDCFSEPIPPQLDMLARKISDRHFGVGSDGLILICKSQQADARMRMFNADGSESEMCGNGIRCVAKYVYDQGICRNETLRIETGRGVLNLNLEVAGGRVQRVDVDMGEPVLASVLIPTTLPGSPVVNADLNIADSNGAGRKLCVTCVSMGNPHCVTFVDELTDDWVLGVGPKLETDPHFPRRVNTEFVQVLSRTEIRMRVWERGSGETLACGTGACAVCVASVLSGRTERKILAHLRGGDLDLHWAEDGHVHMTGPAVEVFRGEWEE
ncbi:MAG: diaminopimelate epimerase [Thermoguttaceae bacterium]